MSGNLVVANDQRIEVCSKEWIDQMIGNDQKITSVIL